MTPAPGAQSLPPLPDFSGQGQGMGMGAAQGPDGGVMASLISGIAPVKTAVDGILAACKQIVQSGAIPGAEQVCGQIVALATGLLPMAAQQMMQPGMGGGATPPAPSPGQGIGQ